MLSRILAYGSIVLLLALTFTVFYFPDSINVISRTLSKKSVSQRLEETRAAFENGLRPHLQAVGLSDNPEFIALVFVKDEKLLHLFAGSESSSMRKIKSYQVKAASGKMGPKLVEGDRQVPEGIYSIESLNPNSMFYLSLRVNYPNPNDRKQAELESRQDLGSDIMIHGSNVSVGCVAIGDESIAELFHLAATSNWSRWKLIFSPTDLRTQKAPMEVIEKLPWMKAIYDEIETEMAKLPQ